MSNRTGDGTGYTKHTVHWFRKGLRLHDNPSLREGLKNSTTFRCVFIIDPWFAGSSNVGINKWRFLLQCLEDLDRSLRKLNSHLFVVRGQPADALPKLFKEWGTTDLTFEEDPEPFGRVRDLNIMAMCKELGISVVSKASHTLYKLDHIIEKNGGKPPLTYHQFQTVIASMDPPPKPEETVTAKLLGSSHTPLSDDHDVKYGVPTLEELGFETDKLKPPVWYGGESEALARLERHLERKAWVASFGHPKMTPQSLLASQTGLSPYLRFGCLSTRLFYYQLTELYKKVFAHHEDPEIYFLGTPGLVTYEPFLKFRNGNELVKFIKKAKPPLSLHGQLLWREFFYCAATKNPNFDKMNGNPICVQIPWDKNSQALAKWANGQTGFPWIDAIMTQLREEGWIHHLARHAVACFLTRGDLWISWEEGMKVFDELLLDADWSVNAGMWMWLSCSSFFQQFFHCYCPVRFGRKADPNGDYIRKYLPVLKNFPTKYIHEPWLAPEEEQRAAKCIIGKDFPLPMVNHSVVSRMNIERMKQVYRQLSKYRGQGVLATVPKSLPMAAMSSNAPDGILNVQNEINLQRQKKGTNREQMEDYRVLGEGMSQNSSEFYGTFADGNVMRGNSVTEPVYNGRSGAMVDAQFSGYMVDNQSRNFQNYRTDSGVINMGNFHRISDSERSYLSSGLKNSPDGYQQPSELSGIENDSNSMNAPFENMGIHSKRIDNPNILPESGHFEAPAYINLESVSHNPSNYHFQNSGALSGNGMNEKFHGNYQSPNLFIDNKSQYGTRSDKDNFGVEPQSQVQIQEEKSST